MLSSILIFSALIKISVESTCQCYEENDYVGLNAPISNGYDDKSFKACYPGPCGYQAYTNIETLGWQSLTITWSRDIKDPDAVLQIWDGQSDTGLPFKTIKAGTSYSSPPLTLLTTTPYIYIKYTQKITTASNTFYGAALAGSPLAPPPDQQTRVHNSTGLSENAQENAHKKRFVFNQESTSSETDRKQ